MSWYREAEHELEELATAVQQRQPLRMDGLERLRTGLLSSLKQSDELVVQALSGPAGSPLVTNLINVGILGAKVGIGLGYFGEALDRLALAGLVHDIGLFAVPPSLVTKRARLTQEERLVIEQHPELGYDLMHRAGPAYEWLAQVIRQVHERYNGKGYPNRLTGGHIGEMAQILGVVDVFDALVSERPYRRRLFPHEAIKELLVAERTAFRREILKALVEQLTVYPLGTTVRLTTGETGTVSRVNKRYPLRPTVEVREHAAAAEGMARQIDLSLTPLISVLETVTPPGANGIAATDPAKTSEPPSISGAASDQFTSLLESLDAIVSAIQGVVESSGAVPRHAAPQSIDQKTPVPAQGIDPSTGEHAFQKEIIGLFALEAREWLGQIQTALVELGAGVEGAVRSKVYGFILNGIMNLGRSASTVHLCDIEAMASNLLPILRDVGRTESQWTAETLRPLHHGLDRIADAVRRLAGEQAGLGGPREQPYGPGSNREAPDTGVGAEGAGPRPVVEVPGRVGASMPLLRALRELQRARARSVQPARDVLDTVIARAQKEVGERQDHVAVDVIRRILHDLDRMDEQFLRDIRERVPAIVDRLAWLRERSKPDYGTAAHLEPILTHVDALHQFAQRIDALTMALFLDGVKALLLAAVSRTADALPQQLQAVEERIKRLIPMAEQWVTLGRLERASIEDILPA